MTDTERRELTQFRVCQACDEMYPEFDMVDCGDMGYPQWVCCDCVQVNHTKGNTLKRSAEVAIARKLGDSPEQVSKNRLGPVYRRHGIRKTRRLFEEAA